MTGNMNGEETTFESVQPNIKQEKFSVILPCDAITEFNPIDQVRASLGWAKIGTAELKLSQCTMTFELLLTEIQDVTADVELGDFDGDFDEDFD